MDHHHDGTKPDEKSTSTNYGGADSSAAPSLNNNNNNNNNNTSSAVVAVSVSASASDQQAQALNKNRFSLWSTLGMQLSVTCTPLAIGSYLSLIIGVGGGPVLFFGYILGAGLNVLVCLTLAEIASAYPHPSGEFPKSLTCFLAPHTFSFSSLVFHHLPPPFLFSIRELGAKHI
jgi:hypothetical protein